MELDQILKKAIEGELTPAEFEILMASLKDTNKDEKLKELLDAHWNKLSTEAQALSGKGNPKAEQLFENILANMDSKKQLPPQVLTPKKRFFQKNGKIVAAAMVVCMFLSAATVFWIQNDFFSTTTTPNPNEITLTLENGETHILREDRSLSVEDAQGNIIGQQEGLHLSYKGQNDMAQKETVYNTLTVPYGRKIDLVLEDGTMVKLNSGSSIRYPTHFNPNDNRKVFLEGEGFFEVVHNSAQPFIVTAGEVDVKVLGTAFNVSYYPEDATLNTVLVEGSVQLDTPSNNTEASSQLLVPGELGAWDKTKKQLSVQKVDVDLHTAWKDGKLLYRKSPFASIEKKLERHFNITIENANEVLKSQVFTATFTDETLGEILDAFSEDTPFNYKYDIAENKILITNNKLNN